MANIISTGIKNFKTLSQGSAQLFRLAKDGMWKNVFIMKLKGARDKHDGDYAFTTRRYNDGDALFRNGDGNER